MRRELGDRPARGDPCDPAPASGQRDPEIAVGSLGDATRVADDASPESSAIAFVSAVIEPRPLTEFSVNQSLSPGPSTMSHGPEPGVSPVWNSVTVGSWATAVAVVVPSASTIATAHNLLQTRARMALFGRECPHLDWTFVRLG